MFCFTSTLFSLCLQQQCFHVSRDTSLYHRHPVQALHMALAMNHHNAYMGGDTSNAPSYPGDGGEPGPAPSLRELVEHCLQGRVVSDPEVKHEYLWYDHDSTAAL